MQIAETLNAGLITVWKLLGIAVNLRWKLVAIVTITGSEMFLSSTRTFKARIKVTNATTLIKHQISHTSVKQFTSVRIRYANIQMIELPNLSIQNLWRT